MKKIIQPAFVEKLVKDATSKNISTALYYVLKMGMVLHPFYLAQGI